MESWSVQGVQMRGRGKERWLLALPSVPQAFYIDRWVVFSLSSTYFWQTQFETIRYISSTSCTNKRLISRGQNYILKTKDNSTRHRPRTGAVEKPIMVVSGNFKLWRKDWTKIRNNKVIPIYSLADVKVLVIWESSGKIGF